MERIDQKTYEARLDNAAEVLDWFFPHENWNLDQMDLCRHAAEKVYRVLVGEEVFSNELFQPPKGENHRDPDCIAS